jgi:hypothetical protein
MKPSVLDCIWSPWPSKRARTGRKLVHLQGRHDWLGRLGGHLCHHKTFRAWTPEVNDQGVAGKIERVHEGRPTVHLSVLSVQTIDNLSQSQNMNPISGISSEGYEGKGMVQSKTAKEQGIKLEEDE